MMDKSNPIHFPKEHGKQALPKYNSFTNDLIYRSIRKLFNIHFYNEPRLELFSI